MMTDLLSEEVRNMAEADPQDRPRLSDIELNDWADRIAVLEENWQLGQASELRDYAKDIIDLREQLEVNIDFVKQYQVEVGLLKEKLEASRTQMGDLRDRLNNGIKYNEELNVYVVCWTKHELEQAQEEADNIYKAMKG